MGATFCDVVLSSFTNDDQNALFVNDATYLNRVWTHLLGLINHI